MAQIGFEGGRPKIYSARPLVGSSSAKSLPPAPLAPSAQIQKTVLPLPLSELSREVAQYQWRARTELPVVRVRGFRVGALADGKCEVEVEVERCAARLPDLSGLPLFQVLYLLREALVGFERLLQRFGPFTPTPRMLALDAAGACRVWLSEDFASNRCLPSAAGHPELLLLLYGLVEGAANRHRATQEFFKDLRTSASFCSALAFIDRYAKAKRIAIPSSCKIAEKDLGKPRFYASLTMNNAPKFLSSLRSSLRPATWNDPAFLLNHLSINEKAEEEEKEEEEGEGESSKSAKVVSSEHTTADLPSKKENGLAVEDQFLFENLLDFGVPLSGPLIRSQHHPPEQTSGLRKLSEQFPSIKQAAGRRQAENGFVSCEEEEVREGEARARQWGGLKGLFDSRRELKKSVHEGREQREAVDFELLSHFGKAIRESYVREETEYSYQH